MRFPRRLPWRYYHVPCPVANLLPSPPEPTYNKQKDLLASPTGHFSLLKALHMADYITAMNGTAAPPRKSPEGLPD